MAVVTEYSDLRTNERASPPVLNSASKNGPIYHATHTQVATGDAGSIIELFTLKANDVLFPDAFFLSNSAGASGAFIDIGYAAHTLPDGTAVAVDQNGIADGVDGDAVNTGLSLGASKVVNSISFAVDVVITAQVTDAEFSIGDTMSCVAICGRTG